MTTKLAIGALLGGLLLMPGDATAESAQEDSLGLDVSTVAEAETLIGLKFTPEERDSLRSDLLDNLASYQAMRDIPLDNSVAPALVFNPIPRGAVFDTVQRPVQFGPPPDVKMPADPNELSFYTLRELSELIRTRQLTSLELTQLCLGRLKKYDTQLHCVITLTEDLALIQAARADAEIASGVYRGPLHGIPYGVKDLLAAKGYPTTWGTRPYEDQIIDRNASVITKLEAAGAVLVAKLSLGALAWGDVWFSDTTRNPWNLAEGSSGSSAGPAAAVSAGLVPFAIGSETWGSIVSPSSRCGVTGLRPTFGRVGRAGAMTLSWSMDKLGPISRTVEDCAIVFNSIYGPDGEDLSVVNLPFNYEPNVDFDQMRIGYLKDDFDLDTAYMDQNQAALQKLRDLGANLIPIELPQIPVYPQGIILVAEAAAAFDELTRSNRDDLMERQSKNAWPNVFRSSRFIPAVEYIQANRLRALSIEAMARLMDSIDVYVAPSFEGDNLLLTNLTGHPCVVLPNGFDKSGSPVSFTFIGRLFGEGRLLAVAKKYQLATDFHRQHPPLFK
ncbi:MAG: amidase [candidate division Zixibacteria bacterium]|nr:amidase [candidate division Zixibacteria bacterium]